MKPVEFSNFYKLLNAVKQGETEKQEQLENLLQEYETAPNGEGPLHQLGQIFIHVGILELYKYVGTTDLQFIGNLEAEAWTQLTEERQAELPPHLANAMITHAKEKKLAQSISKQWSSSRREVNNNIMGMARYITEGILDAIE